jgi:hypothetical protein
VPSATCTAITGRAIIIAVITADPATTPIPIIMDRAITGTIARTASITNAGRGSILASGSEPTKDSQSEFRFAQDRRYHA